MVVLCWDLIWICCLCWMCCLLKVVWFVLFDVCDLVCWLWVGCWCDCVRWWVICCWLGLGVVLCWCCVLLNCVSVLVNWCRMGKLFYVWLRCLILNSWLGFLCCGLVKGLLKILDWIWLFVLVRKCLVCVCVLCRNWIKIVSCYVMGLLIWKLVLWSRWWCWNCVCRYCFGIVLLVLCVWGMCWVKVRLCFFVMWLGVIFMFYVRVKIRGWLMRFWVCLDWNGWLLLLLVVFWWCWFWFGFLIWLLVFLNDILEICVLVCIVFFFWLLYWRLWFYCFGIWGLMLI